MKNPMKVVIFGDFSGIIPSTATLGHSPAAPPRASLGRRVGSAAAGALPPPAGSEKRTRPGRPEKDRKSWENVIWGFNEFLMGFQQKL